MVYVWWYFAWLAVFINEKLNFEHLFIVRCSPCHFWYLSMFKAVDVFVECPQWWKTITISVSLIVLNVFTCSLCSMRWKINLSPSWSLPEYLRTSTMYYINHHLLLQKTSQRLVVNSVYSAITTKPPQVIIKQATILFLTTVFPPLLCSNAIPYPLNCFACTAVISFICDKKPQSYWNKCNVISNQISYFQTCIKTNLVPSLHDNISMWLSFFFY